MNWTTTPVTLGGITTTVCGQYDTAERWNGYLCPWLDAHGVVTVLDALARAYAAAQDEYQPTYEWTAAGDLLLTEHHDDAHYTTRYEPDADGLYQLGAHGWVWTEHDEMRCDILLRIERAKREVLADMAAGRVPTDVRDFATLHDYVDANEYGGLTEDGAFATADDMVAVGNVVQDMVHLWLKGGRW